MNQQLTETYYRIRFPNNSGNWNEWYHSNNGTTRWGELKQIKALITRGIPTGYNGHIRQDFKDYEIVKVTDVINRNIEVIELEDKKDDYKSR